MTEKQNKQFNELLKQLDEVLFQLASKSRDIFPQYSKLHWVYKGFEQLQKNISKDVK